ncbi:hypothetical protein KR222_010901 [Zaprionus bogoriensis]|nr:hypothetical protein KR222_010901 [Zaprionus bogoriensis]
MAEEKTVQLLWSCAQQLTTQTHAERLLKSHYINTCRKFARHNVQLPEDCVGAARMCARCGNQWRDGNYQLQLRPQRLAATAKRRRQIAQLDALKAKGQPKGGGGRLSTGARKRAKWLKKRMASSVAVNCEVCAHKTILPLEKHKKRAKTETMETTAEITAAAATPATDKRKKQQQSKQNKDVNAGLKPQQQQQQKAAPAAASKTPKTNAAKTPATTKTNATKTPATTKTNATKTPAPTTKTQQKQKQKSKAAQSTPTHAAAAKIQSKTQKQNALLQLAAQLKAHASKNAGKTPQNRLQAFLK